jgi:hypothetical protein
VKALGFILLLLVCLAQTGCVTAETIDAARGHPSKDAYGQTFHASRPKPAMYLLVPLAATADVALVPLLVLTFLIPRPIC